LSENTLSPALTDVAEQVSTFNTQFYLILEILIN